MITWEVASHISVGVAIAAGSSLTVVSLIKLIGMCIAIRGTSGESRITIHADFDASLQPRSRRNCGRRCSCNSVTKSRT